MSVTIQVSSPLGDVARYFEALPELAMRAAYLALNDGARDALPMLRADMESQVSFPKGYLNATRLGIRTKASMQSLEAVISGRDRPTSLARFAEGATPQNSRGRPIFVRVKPGKTVALKRAFLVNLRNGNTGLAVRLAPGQTLKNSDGAVRLANNLYLLYGPSVDQVMQDVSDKQAPRIADKTAKNFIRQFERLARG